MCTTWTRLAPTPRQCDLSPHGFQRAPVRHEHSDAKDRSTWGEKPISDLSRGEFAVLVSELDDRIEELDRSERKWARLKIPAALVVAVATYVVFAVVGVPGLGLWILTNVLLGLLILFGGQFVHDRQRRSLDQQRAELSSLAPTPDDDSLLLGTKDPEVGYGEL